MVTIVRPGDSKNISKEEGAIHTLNAFRMEQRGLTTKLIEYEREDGELKNVIEALSEVEGSRRCFRMVKDVLIESTVEKILPTLGKRKEELATLLTNTKSELNAKIEEVEKFKEEHKDMFTNPAFQKMHNPVVLIPEETESESQTTAIIEPSHSSKSVGAASTSH